MSKLKLFVFLFLLAIGTGVIEQASAQSLPQFPASTNIDDLSDQQIRLAMQRAQAAGLTDNEILQQAANGGLSNAQVQKLGARIRDIRAKDAGTTGFGDTSRVIGRQLNYKPDAADSNNQRDIFEGFKPKIFGADIFKGKNTLFEPNLNIATPANYMVGPGDQININVYGKSINNWNLRVTPDGKINIPNIGILNVGGKTIEVVTDLIKSRLIANHFAIGNGTEAVVSIGNIRSIKVMVIGLLARPNTYTLPSLATVFTALYAAGGPTENGSLRKIEVIRNSKVFRTLDVYDFLVKGSQKDNVTLQDGDIVRVPAYTTRVELAGQVKIPALFEVLPGETLKNVLDYAGGFTDSANTARISVLQIKDQQHALADVVEADYANYIPLRGDKFIVQSVISRIQNRVIIRGAVFRPDQYELSKGMTLAQLIEKASGVKEDAFDRGSIARLKVDNSKELIPFSLADVLSGKMNIALQREDIVNISSKFDLRDKYQITISGSVRKPGIFPFQENMKVEDLIVAADGFSEGANPKHIEVARRVNDADPQSKSSKSSTVFTVDVDSQLKLDNVNFVLMPFDIVYVYTLPGYEKQKTVRIEGEVVTPGPYPLTTKDEKISDLVARAGGLTASADIEGGSLKRENIAILGIDKNKSDTTAIAKEHSDQLNRLKKTYNNGKDSTKTEDTQPRNNYVGIDLPGILKSPGSKIDLLLEDGDVLRIPKQQQVVRVNGEVLYPSAVVYDSGKSFKEYVLNAGGFAPGALKSGAYIVYPNGTVRGTRKFLFFNSHPKVRPGSEIYVPKKPVHIGNSAQEILGFSAGIASLAAIIIEIINISK